MGVALDRPLLALQRHQKPRPISYGFRLLRTREPRALESLIRL